MMTLSVGPVSVKVTTREKATVTRFDSAHVAHSDSFALGLGLIDWDQLAADYFDGQALEDGYVLSRSDEPAEVLPVEVAAPIEVEPIRSPRVATDGIPATATRVRFVNYNSPAPCVRYLEAWVEETTGRVRISYERADELYRQGRVAILPDKPEPTPSRASKPAPKPAPKVVSEDARYASRLAYLKIASFSEAEVSDDFHALNSRRQARQLAAV